MLWAGRKSIPAAVKSARKLKMQSLKQDFSRGSRVLVPAGDMTISEAGRVKLKSSSGFLMHGRLLYASKVSSILYSAYLTAKCSAHRISAGGREM